jgi:hypothetical protein
VDPTHLTISEIRHLLDEGAVAQSFSACTSNGSTPPTTTSKHFSRLTTAKAAEQAQAADRAARRHHPGRSPGFRWQ